MNNDLISRSALLESYGLKNAVKYGNETAEQQHNSYSTLMLYEIADMINDAPAVDAVEVVRKPVVGYEGYYEVDQFGRIYSVDRSIDVVDCSRVYSKKLCGKQMKQSMHTKGYKTVSLTREGKTKTEFVHRVVAKAFLPNPMNYEMINHIDEDKTNNFLENLEWCNASYNRTYGKAVEKHARKIRGIPHSEEHKRKISESVKRTLMQRKIDAEVSDVDK